MPIVGHASGHEDGDDGIDDCSCSCNNDDGFDEMVVVVVVVDDDDDDDMFCLLLGLASHLALSLPVHVQMFQRMQVGLLQRKNSDNT